MEFQRKEQNLSILFRQAAWKLVAPCIISPIRKIIFGLNLQDYLWYEVCSGLQAEYEAMPGSLGMWQRNLHYPFFVLGKELSNCIRRVISEQNRCTIPLDQRNFGLAEYFCLTPTSFVSWCSTWAGGSHTSQVTVLGFGPT